MDSIIPWLEPANPGLSWMGPFDKKFHCNGCHAIIETMLCPVCGNQHDTSFGEFKDVKGKVHRYTLAFQGPITHISLLYINLLQREWELPESIPDSRLNLWNTGVPQKYGIVLLFWSYFEHLMDVLLTQGLRDTPARIADHLMNRNNSVGQRMGKFYQLVFNRKFNEDLKDLGYGYIYEHLKNLQQKRNEFIHGNPQSITEELLNDTLRYFPDTLQAWILLYNNTCRLK
jgi:hypothetical protein